MDYKTTLEKIGLSPNEAKIYLYLVDHGQSKAGKIAKGSYIQRSSAYMAINSLVAKGLVGYITIGKVKFFTATSPNRILEFIKEKETFAKDLIPLLKEKHKQTKEEGQVRMFKGDRGVMAVFKDIIRSKEHNDVWGEDGNLAKRMPIFASQFVRDQNEHNIKTRIITREKLITYSKGTTYRFVDETTKSNIAVNIYGGKIAIIIWTDDPEAVIIENETAAKAFKSYFEFMWKHAKIKQNS
jgi:HTH-type transcriptional regulator, sugar sensing transcriptional regulator